MMEERVNKFWWLVLRNSCTFAEVVSFLALEKLIDIETSSVNKIALVFSLQNLFVILMFLGSKYVDRWNRQLMLSLGLVSVSVSIILGSRIPYWFHLNVVFFMSYIMYSIVPTTSLYLEKISSLESRPTYLSKASFYRTTFQVVVLFGSVYTLSSLLSVKVYLGMALVFIILILVSLHKLRSYAPSPLIKNRNWSDIFKVLKFCWKMFLVYGLFCFIIRGIILINQQYLKEVFGISGYQFSLPYKGMVYVGGLVASLIVTSLVKKMSYKTYVVLSLLGVISLSLSIYYQSSIMVINCFGFLLGVANYGMTLYFNIEIHKSFSGVDLKNIATLTYLLPFLTAFLSVTLFRYASDYGIVAMNQILFIGSIGIMLYVLNLRNIKITK